MKINRYKNDVIKEHYSEYIFDSGFRVIFIPKKGFFTKGAYVNCNFGSMCTKFINGKGELIVHPEGSAHFLEHKLFENKDINIFEKMGEYGADVNAFTSNINTCFYFKTLKNFDKCLELLLTIPTQRKYTEKGIRAEENIIAREIDMYLDNVTYKSYYNAISKLYPVHPVGKDIAGTKESIKDVTMKTLDEIMDNFYIPSNMSLIIAGDFEEKEVLEMIENVPEFYHNKKNLPKVIFDFDKAKDSEDYIYEEKDVLQSYTYIIKLDFVGDKKSVFEQKIAYDIVLDVVFGQSSSFYKSAYTSGLFIDFNARYNVGDNYSNICFDGESNNPIELKKRIDEAITQFYKNGISENDVNRSKRKMLGRFLSSFNSISSSAFTFLQLDMFDISYLDYSTIVSNIKIADYNITFDGEKVLSVIGRKED